jgi:hypothetical protein
MRMYHRITEQALVGSPVPAKIVIIFIGIKSEISFAAYCFIWPVDELALK